MLYSSLFKGLEIIDSNIQGDPEIIHVCSDSRKIKKGSVFVCLKGMKYDGHAWINDALENGAEFVVVQEKPRRDFPYVQVADTRSALPLLLSQLYGHPQKSFKHIIGITGTNGKTTTSFMIKAIMEKAGYKTGLIGTTKYLIGNDEYPVDKSELLLTTPDPELLFELLAAMRDRNVDCVIMEASSHSLQLKKLTGIHFTIGIFTNLTQDHIDFHGTMDSYLNAKKKLFENCDIGIFNFDDKAFENISSDVPCKKVSYSIENNGADYIAKNIRLKGAEGIEYELLSQNLIFRIKSSIPGKFTIYNSLAAASCALEAGVTPEVISSALSEMSGVKGRIERVETDTPFSVFIDFAHTPDALEKILNSIREFARGRIVTLFGCGGDRDKTKRPIMGRIVCEKSDFVIITSDNSRTEEKEDIINDILEGVKGTKTPYITITDRTEAIKYAIDNAQDDDIILLAGKGHEEYEIDKTGKHSYSERQIVTDYIKRRAYQEND